MRLLSTASQRKALGQAKVRSTTQRLTTGTKPRVMGGLVLLAQGVDLPGK